MSTETETYPSEAAYDEYRALCPAAVTSLILGLLAGLAFYSIFFGIIPVLGILIGIYALAQIRGRARELTGGGLAWAGIAMSLVLLLGSWATIGVIYLTEVPGDERRTHYSELQPRKGATPGSIPPLAQELNGKKIFIKGYVLPGPKRNGIKTFLLVRDKGDCCFGSDPKITERIQVTLEDPLRLQFSTGVHKLAGVFKVEKKTVKQAEVKKEADQSVYYHLQAYHLK